MPIVSTLGGAVGTYFKYSSFALYKDTRKTEIIICMTYNLRDLIIEDLQFLDQATGVLKSYILDRSSLGLSKTELKQSLKGLDPHRRELVMIDNEKQIQGFLRLHKPNLISRSMRIQPLFFENVDQNQYSTTCQTLIRDIVEYENISRFYSYLLEEEEVEAQILQTCGFEIEARLNKQVFANGSYKTQLVMGTDRLGGNVR